MKKKDKTITFRCDTVSYNRLNAVSKKSGISPCECMRRLIDEAFVANSVVVVHAPQKKWQNLSPLQVSKIIKVLSQLMKTLNGAIQALHDSPSERADNHVRMIEWIVGQIRWFCCELGLELDTYSNESRDV